MTYKLILILLLLTSALIAQDDPSGYTNNFRLRMWDEGAHPGADSVNQNLIDLDLHLHNRDLRVDSLKTAFSWMFNFPSGTFKRYDSNEFDNDTLKVKAGVFPKLGSNNSFTGINSLSNSQTNFGNGGTILNFVVTNDEGEIIFRKNGSTDLLIYDDDGQYWDFKKYLNTPALNVSGNTELSGLVTLKKKVSMTPGVTEKASVDTNGMGKFTGLTLYNQDTVTFSDGGTITIGSKSYIRIKGNTNHATFSLSSGTYPGQIVIIQNYHDTYDCLISSSINMLLKDAMDISLSAKGCACFLFDGVYWIEQYRAEYVE